MHLPICIAKTQLDYHQRNLEILICVVYLSLSSFNQKKVRDCSLFRLEFVTLNVKVSLNFEL